MTRRETLTGSASLLAFGLWGRSAVAAMAARYPMVRTEAEWRQKLTPTQYAILRGRGTERPGSSPLEAESRFGYYSCAGCDQALFSSVTKFHSDTGWPSFYAPISGALAESPDHTSMVKRTEVHCTRCGSHIGHVFGDGPKPTGLRYCMNGYAMEFHAT